MKQRTCLLLLLLLLTVYAHAGFVKVAIVGTNDIHGSALPTQLYRSDLNQNYTYGGLEYMASMISTLKEEFKGNFLYLDAGDQFQGGIEAGPLVSSGQIINDYMNEVSVDSSAIGNHQFDFGPSFLFPYINNRKDGSWNLAANLHSETGNEQFLPKQKNMWIFTLQSGIKIGVIGLTTIETPFTTGAFTDGSFPAYRFKEYTEIVMKSSAKLRADGVNAVILVSHMGNDCNADNTRGYWQESTPQQSSCSQTDEMSLLLKSLPQGTIDGVVQGHRHKFSHHFINGVPVMGTINGGYYFNVMYLFFYDKTIYNKAIDGPWPVCEKVFSNLGRCNYLTKNELQSAGNLVEWEFHGVKVIKHPEVSRLFETKWLPKMNKFLEPLALNQLTLQRKFDSESLLGNLITDLVFKACPGHDFVLLNEGGFRTIWYPGIIQYQHFYNMFPFLNDIISFEMTGRQLIKTLEVLQSGKKSFYPTKNLKQRVKIHSNGTRELTSVTFYDGTPIEETKSYRGLSLDFLLSGGDDFQKVMGKIYTLRRQTKMGEFKELLKPQMISLGMIVQTKLRDPLNPRLIIDRL